MTTKHQTPKDLTSPQPDLAALGGRGVLPPELRGAPGMRRLDYILQLADPAELVGGMAVQELYLLLHDIGMQDSCALLEYASRDQLQGLLDMDLWSGTEIQLQRWFAWLDLAKGVSPEVALELTAATDPEIFQLMFLRGVEVRSHDEEIDDVPDDIQCLESPDFAYWVLVPREHELAERLPELMRYLWAVDLDTAHQLFDALRFELPSSLEESLLQLRSGRIADLGFPMPDDVAELAAPLDARAARQRVRDDLDDLALVDPFDQGTVGEDLALRGVRPTPFLADALGRLGDDERARFAQAMVYLVNGVLMALTRDLSHVGQLPRAGRHAAAMVGLGLAYLADESPSRAAAALRHVAPREAYRVAVSLLAELAHRARRVRARAGVADGLCLFGAPTDDVLDGAARPMPVYFEGLDGQGAVTFRDFEAPADVAAVEVRVADAEALLDFFEQRLGFSTHALAGARLDGLSEDDRRLVRFAGLFRTALANLALTDELRLTPLDHADLAAFLTLAIEGGRLAPRIRELPRRLGPDAPEALARWMDGALEELELALGRVGLHELEPRYAAELFLVRSDAQVDRDA